MTTSPLSYAWQSKSECYPDTCSAANGQELAITGNGCPDISWFWWVLAGAGLLLLTGKQRRAS